VLVVLTVLIFSTPSITLGLQPEEIPASLKGITVPPTPGLLDGPEPIVIDKAAAIQLGKALFWDMNVGSDGIACATCHFHAGSDRRTRNQLEPGTRHHAPTGNTFQKTASGADGGINYDLKPSDFPFFQFENPADKHSKRLFSSDDVVSSSGTLFGQFRSTSASDPSGHDVCSPLSDDIFHLGSANSRRVTSRHAPTVINAALNYRNFWDGRANNLFNGETPYGPRNPEAGVWELRDGKIQKNHILLENASLASQAVAPPLDTKEMSCQGRTFENLARKLLTRRPLDRQKVHPDDSVLAPLRDRSGKGLATHYQELIRKAFAQRYWSGNGDFGSPSINAPSYSQMEANFPFFFGLAIQLYETTLISDQSPFDSPRGPDGYPSAFNQQQKRGLTVFQDSLCFKCHGGAALTVAAMPTQPQTLSRLPRLVDRRVLNGDFDGDGVVQALMDIGFANTSVTPTEFDIGLGGSDPMGHPLSYAEQYQNNLMTPGKPMVDPVHVIPCYFTFPYTKDYQQDELISNRTDKAECHYLRSFDAVPKPHVTKLEMEKPDQGKMLAAVKGAFKIPTLRNIELTGPFMHNGSLKNLEEVVAFYDRAGNTSNRHHFATLVFPHGFSTEQKSDLVAFLESLTDERVRWERAPFDHPELRVPNGTTPVTENAMNTVQKEDVFVIPAVGQSGRPVELGGLRSFAEILTP
jgi:cytochrome c peroxidase